MLCNGGFFCGAAKSKNPFGEDNDSDDGTSYGFVRPEVSRRKSIFRKASSAELQDKKPPRRVSFREDIPCRGDGSCRQQRYQNVRHKTCAQNQTWSCPIPTATRCVFGNEIYEVLPRGRPVQRSVSCTNSSVLCSHYLRRPLPEFEPLKPLRQSAMTASPPPVRPGPPAYNIAVQRAASFSAARGVNRGNIPKYPPPPPAGAPRRRSVSPAIRPNLRGLSSSTSDLYVDSTSLKRTRSPELSAASSASSISEATVYKRVGPYNYVSVSEKPSTQTKSLPNSQLNPRRPTTLYLPSTDLENADKCRPLSADLNLPRTDTYRFSMANLEDTQDVDLDAILGELCALESQYKENLSPRNSVGSDISNHRRTPSNSLPQSGAVVRTESPDNDSAFSDSVSLFSSESSTSSSTTPSTHNIPTNNGDSKAEKIRLALQKMKEANVKKLFVKVFSKDGGTKSLLVDESMKCGYVMRLLADKNHVTINPRWGLVEHLPELYMERVYEEHEALVDNLMLWTRESKNKLYFVERPERLLLFQRPEIFHPDFTSGSTLDDVIAQNSLVEEYLSSSGLPNVEGLLHIKMDARKGWKKYHAVLRASGLYYYKDKTSKSSKDLACLATFDVNQVYYGVGWKKKFKAPTEHCFAIKHPCLQQPKSTKYIKYLCADDALTLHKWVTAIRIIKYGHQLLDNYQSMMTVEDCEELSDSGSSGCDVAFESDFPCGTIKRKPPKLPLTATTRQLAQLDTRSNPIVLERVPSFGSLPPPPPELLASSLTLNEEATELPLPPPPPRLLPPPNETFLQDLQRVMRRKWQVAQKCKQDLTTTPHEVLGFRDPPDYRETNVSNWVAEHYGGQNLYENIYRSGSQPPPPPIPTVPKTVTTPIKKRPPPPPPPRSQTTHLTSRIQHL